MNVAIAIVGLLIAIGSFFGAIGTYAAAQSAIHQIYASLLMITSVLGLLILAVAVGAATVRDGIVKGQERASTERRMLADALRLVAEHRSS
jgi:hypothetical protein